MNKKRAVKPVSVAVSAAFITSLATAGVATAAGNPFSMTELSSGYMVADSHEGKCGGMSKTMEEGKCGEGKCGAKREAHEGKCGSDMKSTKEGKCGEGKCGAKREAHEGKCGGETKPMKEGKCGEGKCGASK